MSANKEKQDEIFSLLYIVEKILEFFPDKGFVESVLIIARMTDSGRIHVRDANNKEFISKALEVLQYELAKRFEIEDQNASTNQDPITDDLLDGKD